jgi:hypothetical protein
MVVLSSFPFHLWEWPLNTNRLRSWTFLGRAPPPVDRFPAELEILSRAEVCTKQAPTLSFPPPPQPSSFTGQRKNYRPWLPECHTACPCPNTQSIRVKYLLVAVSRGDGSPRRSMSGIKVKGKSNGVTHCKPRCVLDHGCRASPWLSIGLSLRPVCSPHLWPCLPPHVLLYPCQKRLEGQKAGRTERAGSDTTKVSGYTN